MPPINYSRRALFKGQVSGRSFVIRPPWSKENFEELCNQCNDCIAACDDRIIKKGDGGFPEIDFSFGGCELCEACAAACKTGALELTQSTPWKLKAFIQDSCLSIRKIFCRTCTDVCDQKAIVFQIQVGGKAIPHLNHELCNGCGFCYAVCPEKAIELKEAS